MKKLTVFLSIGFLLLALSGNLHAGLFDFSKKPATSITATRQQVKPAPAPLPSKQTLVPVLPAVPMSPSACPAEPANADVTDYSLSFIVQPSESSKRVLSTLRQHPINSTIGAPLSADYADATFLNPEDLQKILVQLVLPWHIEGVVHGNPANFTVMYQFRGLEQVFPVQTRFVPKYPSGNQYSYEIPIAEFSQELSQGGGTLLIELCGTSEDKTQLWDRKFIISLHTGSSNDMIGTVLVSNVLLDDRESLGVSLSFLGLRDFIGFSYPVPPAAQ